ncbi:MAG TPA: FAD binding domain-containing protein [Thermoanaerobaculia bacterium]|jgi:4-hydroxybenzoyl-CoA reductase subunit beta|nr:FAD binding domain-containing protein [Thermoanaerobaculia bacterium]
MLRLPQFRYLQAKSLEEAGAILAGEGAAEGESVRLVAGGTDLWPNMKRRHQKAQTVVSLMGIPGLNGIHANGEVRIGATTLLDDIVRHSAVRQRYPAFATAVHSISSPPLRNMGTIGGNLCVDTRCTYYNQTEEWRRSIDYCMKEEGTICWVATSSPRCLAHTASDSAPMACALGARVRLVSAQGERTIPVENLFRNDGIDYLAKRPDEILTDLFLPAEATGNRCGTAFWKLRRRGSIDFAVLSAAVALWTDPAGVITRARIYLGAVSSAPLAVPNAEALLVGKPATPDLLAEAAKLARKAATPMDNTDFQTQWRGIMAQRYTEAALREAAGLPVERLAPKHEVFGGG